ncbi:MAG: hypothetical protein MG2_0936 [uncultured Candidatus Poseidoniales archaeon]|nr:MAG: hypothetical protein MG2_0936 [uncultured Candidatus Poseidoniales archaeon]
MYQQTDSDKLQGSIRIPIETNWIFKGISVRLQSPALT